MDADHFDALTRALVSRRSRRRLAATAGAVGGGLLAGPLFGGAHDALAKNKKGKGKKKKTKQAPCRAGECCTDNTPGCPAGLKCCGEACIDKSWCCEFGAAKEPDCGQTCCHLDEECCGGQCYSVFDRPICDPCRPEKCVSGQGFKCVPVMEGTTPCGNECCPKGQECCAENGCYDPETQCCGTGGNVGSICDGVGCCVSTAPYKQSCCAVQGFSFKRCWGLLSPCSTCEYQCGATCCKADTKCCFALADGSKPDRCISYDENCFD